MKRKEFIKKTALAAVAITTSGFIRYDGIRFVGDCETTSDLLGPFYRPNSPVRNNLVVSSNSQEIIVLKGIVRHDDCMTPYNNAKIELWHCDNEGQYDNTSNQFICRGTTYCDSDGQYEFTTQLPVPYPDGPLMRPAHFHFLISAPGYQNLITQVYVKGDPYIKEDLASSSKFASNRILEVTQEDGIKTIIFDITLAKKLAVSPIGLDKLIGVYKSTESEKMIDLFKKDGTIWLKNEVFGEPFEYKGNNHFEYIGFPENTYWILDFEFTTDGQILLMEKSFWEPGSEHTEVFRKVS